MGKIEIIESIAKYFVKPGKSLLAHTNPQTAETFSCALKDSKITREVEASLGDASLFIENLLQSQQSGAKKEIFALFDRLSSVKEIHNRPKGAMSIITKLTRGLNKSKTQSFNSMQEAVACIEDGIGSRVITKSLKKLNTAEIEQMISKMTIEGRKLTAEETMLLRKYIYIKSQ